MKGYVECRCIVCQLTFCCEECRWKHERVTHGLVYDCPVCRGREFLCKQQELNQVFIQHLVEKHSPLHCKKCRKIFKSMDDFSNIDKCTSISEILEDSAIVRSKSQEVDKKFDSLYEKVDKNEGNNFECIISVNKNSKTAVITPVVRKKNLVDYESSDSECEQNSNDAKKVTHTSSLPSKTPKSKKQRVATPHVKKLLSLMRQKVVEEYEETAQDVEEYDGSPVTNKTTPSRNDNEPMAEIRCEMTTPTSHLPHLLKLVQTVTTSTPTHPATGGWSLFPDPGTDSPLSEIENAESSAQSIVNERSKTEADNILPKLKSIIATGSQTRLDSQDSQEKHVTFQDSQGNSCSSVKIKRVKFAEDTIFESEPKVKKRVFRKPKRMLTPGPQKPKFCHNPRFQALLNRFECQGVTVARTPVSTIRELPPSDTPPIGEHVNKPARAIDFKEGSPVVEDNPSKDTNELYKSCIDSPVTQETKTVSNAITALTANIAGSLQTCLSSLLKTNEEQTEIQFQFVITKKKLSVKRLAEEGDIDEANLCDVDGIETNKENIWSSVAKAVKNVFWGGQEHHFDSTVQTSVDTMKNVCTSASKRRFCQVSDSERSPQPFKRHKYEGRIKGRPPLRRSKTWAVARRDTSALQDDLTNQSF